MFTVSILLESMIFNIKLKKIIYIYEKDSYFEGFDQKYVDLNLIDYFKINSSFRTQENKKGGKHLKYLTDCEEN